MTSHQTPLLQSCELVDPSEQQGGCTYESRSGCQPIYASDGCVQAQVRTVHSCSKGSPNPKESGQQCHLQYSSPAMPPHESPKRFQERNRGGNHHDRYHECPPQDKEASQHE